MGGLEITLVVSAAVAGLTGTWSPCGFSMIETIGPVGHRGGRSTTFSACLTFTLGALAGGVITFGLLALAGEFVHGAGGSVAYSVAAAIALAAAIAELRGTPILPQLRRQLPEHWRRLMPMPVAAGLYGVLLGLGFTTFVLTFGVFALAAIAFALGEPATGVVVGLAFGIGRALPIALIAPIADRSLGIRVTTLMAERPAIYRGFRVGDAIALAGCAAALLVAVPAGAAETEVRPAADPGVREDGFVFQRPDGTGVLERGGKETVLPGEDPALGGGRIALIRGGEIVVFSALDVSEIGRFPALGADAVTISKNWVVWRAHSNGRDYLRARKLKNPDNPGAQRSLGRSSRLAQLGRPSLDRNRVVYARASSAENSIVKRVLGAKGRKARETTLIRSGVEGLSNPSLYGKRMLYVHHTARADRLKLAALGRGATGRTLLSHRRGTLWSTSLTDKRAYVTVISGAGPRQRIVSVAR